MGIPAILALLFNYEFTIAEVLWSFSIFLEAVAILPQMFLLQRIGEAETITTHYIFALGAYRALYLLNWIYRYVCTTFVSANAEWNLTLFLTQAHFWGQSSLWLHYVHCRSCSNRLIWRLFLQYVYSALILKSTSHMWSRVRSSNFPHKLIDPCHVHNAHHIMSKKRSIRPLPQRYHEARHIAKDMRKKIRSQSGSRTRVLSALHKEMWERHILTVVLTRSLYNSAWNGH